MDFWSLASRSLIVLAGCGGGLLLAGLIYYVFFEDNIVSSGNENSQRSGKVLKVASVLFFLAAVYVLYLSVLPAVVVSFLAMWIARLFWAIGTGMVHAGEIYDALAVFDDDPDPVRHYLRGTSSYREVQDLRKVARQIFPRGGRTLNELEVVIDREVGAHYPRFREPTSQNESS